MEKVQEELKRESQLQDPHITGQFTRETSRSTHWSELGVGQIQQPEGRYKADEFARHVLRRSDAALDHATSIVSTVFRMARRMGRLNLSSLNHCARTLVGSMLDHPNALMWTLRTKRSSGHVYRRSVGCAVYSIALGQKLRYEKDMLAELALGGLLLDIGKIAVPVPILAKPGALSATERMMAQRHVDRGFELMQSNGVASERVSEMVLGHHERLDGSGYPQRMCGTEIPIFARIAAIVDTFDALTVDRPYAMSLSPHAGLRRLDADRGFKFDGALVDQFLGALGAYPTGTWVKLADGSVGIVCVQSPDDPLRPRIAIFLDPDDQPLSSLQWFEPDDPTEIAETLAPASQPADAGRLERTLQVGLYPG